MTFLSPGDLPDPGIEPLFLISLVLTGGFFTTSATWEAHEYAPFSLKRSTTARIASKPKVCRATVCVY